MDEKAREAAVIQASIAAAQPDEAVRKALEGHSFGSGRVVLVAAGKGAWQMAQAASNILGSRIDTGIVITKYDHSKGPIANFVIREAGHPIPDDNSFSATQQAIDLVTGLTAQDTVLFLLSGGGSALFEKPLIPAADLEALTHSLLVCGADIVEINTLRKRFSGVKGGRFAQLCAPAHVFSIVLSDILGDPLDMIASGPAYPDSSTCEQAKQIVQKYQLPMTEQMRTLLEQETPKQLDTAGVLNMGSDDDEICRYLEIPRIEIGAFQPVRPEDQERNLKMMEDADVVIVADIPFGEANIHNLDGLEYVKGELYINENIKKQDFTGGKLEKRLEEILKVKNFKFYDSRMDGNALAGILQ